MFIALIAIASACIASVHDGDTVTLCSGERVRILDIDAPELAGSPRCKDRRKRASAWCDHRQGIASRDALAAFLRGGPVRIDRQAKDRYGRTLARLTVNGKDAGAYLIAHGYARRWR